MTHHASKREFLRRAGALAAAGITSPWALSLAGLAGASAHATLSSDYQALVCVYLYGGNDCHNTVVPLDDSQHPLYFTARGGAGGIGLPKVSLENSELVPGPLGTPWPTRRRMALHPSLRGVDGVPNLCELYDAGQLALVMNVGTLMRSGTTRSDFDRGVDLPPKLFSHNDQQSVWQAGAAEGTPFGWGGLMGDLFMEDGLGNASFTAISASGNAVFLSGRKVMPYQVSPDGPVAVASPMLGRSDVAQAVREIMREPSAHHLEGSHARMAGQAIDSEVQVRAAIGDRDVNLCRLQGNALSRQLNIVARLIQADLGTRRQVFFVSAGGFDLHDGLAARQPGQLAALGSAMAAFQRALDTMGLGRQVTTFTASDFGRSLTSNGDGSDHGWGGHQFVMGGALKPRHWVGQVPLFDAAEPGGIAREQQVGNGRLLPFHAVEEYGSTLARWMGIAPGDMHRVFGRIGEFDTPDLGLFA